MSRKSRLIVVVAIVALAGLIVMGCGQKPTAGGGTNEAAVNAAGNAATNTPAVGGAENGASDNAEASMGSGEDSAEAAAAAKIIGAATEHGDAAAKVFIEVFYPRSGHEHIIKLAFDLADKYPGKVRVKAYDWAGNDADRKVWRDRGLSCGAILLNGKETVDIKDAKGKKRTVTFMMGMGGEWTKQDLQDAVAQAVKQAYPG